MKLAICDDEKEMRSYIAGVARENFPELTVEEHEKADDMITSNYDADILFLGAIYAHKPANPCK